MRQHRAGRVQLEQRITNQAELVNHLAPPAGVATGKQRPGFLGRVDAFARLRQDGRVVPTQRRQLVVHRLCGLQTEGLTHRDQVRGLGRRGAVGLRTKEQQVVQQGLRHLVLTLRERGKLQQDARRRALDIHIGRQQLVSHRLKVGGCHTPESLRARLSCTSRQTRAELGQLLCTRRALRLDHQQHQPVKQRTQRCIAAQRRGVGRRRHIHAARLIGPQVGRVYPLGGGQLLHFAVLHKQCHRLHRLVVEHRLQVLNQREAGLLDLARGLFVAHQRALHKSLHRRFHGPQHLGWSTQPHHFEGTHGLVNLLARHAQRTGVDRFQVVVARLLGLTDEALDGFVRGVQRFAQLVEYPGQRTEVGERSVRLRTVGSGGVQHVGVRLGLERVLRDQGLTVRQAILNRATDWRSSSAMTDNSRTCWAVDRVPSPVCSVTAKMC